MILLNCIKNKRLNWNLRRNLADIVYQPYHDSLDETNKKFLKIVKDIYMKFLFSEKEIEYLKKCNKYLCEQRSYHGSNKMKLLEKLLPTKYRSKSRGGYLLPSTDPGRVYEGKTFEKNFIPDYSLRTTISSDIYYELTKELGIEKVPAGVGDWWGKGKDCEEKIISELNKPENSKIRDEFVEVSIELLRKYYLCANVLRDDPSIYQNSSDREPFEGIYTFNQLYSIRPDIYEKLVKKVFLEDHKYQGHVYSKIMKELSFRSDDRPIGEKLKDVESILGLE